MGVFYYVGAVALAEDIPDVEFDGDLLKFYADMDKGFQQVRHINTIFITFSIMQLNTNLL